MSGAVAGRVAGLAALVTLTWMVAANGPAMPSGTMLGFLHLIDLVFHEAGHVIFGFFGRFIAVLGGSAMQVLVPLVCTVAFLTRRQGAAAATTLFWTGQSLADGLIHDWNYILGTLGWLDHAVRLGRLTFGLGVVTMLSALVLLALDLCAACYPATVAQDS